MLAAEKRGPKIGDAASLWNFTPSPGWTKDEVHILRLCLMKFGIGKWVQILETGLLPGKLIQQLNGQTQRLLGQQSLAAYTGLQVDLDRIRADNEGKTDAPRKQGLIINTGANLTKEVKEKLRQEAKVKYGLDQEQIREAEEQLDALSAKLKATAAASAFKVEDQLLASDASAMSTDDKRALLKQLHAKLSALHGLVTNADMPQQQQTDAAGPSPTSEQENKANAMDVDAGEGVPGYYNMAKHATGKRKAAGSSIPAAKPKAKAQSKPRQQPLKEDSDSEDAAMCSDGDDEGMPDASAVIIASDIQQLTSMGFSKNQARDALEEAGGDLETAANWLVANCV